MSQHTRSDQKRPPAPLHPPPSPLTPAVSCSLYRSSYNSHMAQRDVHLEEDVSIHIFTASAAMVGVCLTVIGLLRVVLSIRGGTTIADDLLALDALLFLVACLLSYFALRTRRARRMHRVERVADSLFIAGLILMVSVCGTIVYELI